MTKTIYYKPAGADKAQSFLVDDIDAYDAVRRFPDDYSFDPPAKVEIEEVKTVFSAMANGDNIPMGNDLQQPQPTVDTGAAADAKSANTGK